MISKIRSLLGISKGSDTKMSLENLRNCYNILLKNEVVNEQNAALLVETIRSIAELLVWGDHHDSTVFDFFLEKQIISYFLLLARQPTKTNLPVQVLQSLHILMENLRNETSILFLFSNNCMNCFVENDFDLQDEETLSQYISLLKVLSLRLNKNTMHLFYNQKTHDFPLYSKTVRFVNHSDRMVRTTVKSILLNIYVAAGSCIFNFVPESACCLHFYGMLQQLVDELVLLDKLVEKPLSFRVRTQISCIVDNHVDALDYFSDIFNLKIDNLSWILSEKIHTFCLKFVYLDSICSSKRGEKTKVSPEIAMRFLAYYLTYVKNDPMLQTFVDSLCYVSPVTNQTTGAAMCAAIINTENKTDDEKSQRQSRFTSTYLLRALDCRSSDYLALQTLVLIYVLKPSNKASFQWRRQVVTELCRIMLYSCVPGSRVRPVTLTFAAWLVLRILDYANGNQVKELLAQCERMSKLSVKSHFQNSDHFVEIFEDEYRRMKLFADKPPICVDNIDLLIAPCDSPISMVPFEYRLPCGQLERQRRSIRIFHAIRTVCLKYRNEVESQLPLNRDDKLVRLNDILDLSDSEIVACDATLNGRTSSYFLVMHPVQLVLVEPHPCKMGCAIVMFCCPLQEIDVVSDKLNRKCLYISLDNSFNEHNRISLERKKVKLTFEDHIRCGTVAAGLQKYQRKARLSKLKRLGKLLEIESICEEASTDVD